MKLIGMGLMFVGVSALVLGAVGVPEINPASAGSTLALLSGALLVLRGRKK